MISPAFQCHLRRLRLRCLCFRDLSVSVAAFVNTNRIFEQIHINNDKVSRIERFYYQCIIVLIDMRYEREGENEKCELHRIVIPLPRTEVLNVYQMSALCVPDYYDYIMIISMRNLWDNAVFRVV